MLCNELITVKPNKVSNNSCENLKWKLCQNDAKRYLFAIKNKYIVNFVGREEIFERLNSD